MSALISRVLVIFYIIFVPLYFGLYATAMISSSPHQAALWFEGGSSDFGPAAFIVLLILWSVPLCLSFIKYVLAGSSTELGNVLLIFALLLVHPVLGAIEAHQWKQKFPVQVMFINLEQASTLGGLCFVAFSVILPFAFISAGVYEIHARADSKDKERKYFAGLCARNRVDARDLAQLMAGLIAYNERLPQFFDPMRKSEDEIARQCLPRHLTMLSKSGLPVDEYLSFVAKAVGVRNMFNLDAGPFEEIDSHLRSVSELGGVDQHMRWLEAMVRHGFMDERFRLFFGLKNHQGTKITLSLASVESRVGEFTSPDEYLEFAKASVPLSVNGEHPESYPEGLAKMSHPVLVRMFKLGGAYRARALQIVQKTQSS